MTPTAVALLGYVFWSLLILLSLAVYRTMLVMRGVKASNSFSPSGEDVGACGKRLTRAHANCFENIGFAAAILLYAIATNQTVVTDGLAMIFLGARVAQSLVHIISTSRPAVTLRFLLFVVQVVILFYWILKLAHLL